MKNFSYSLSLVFIIVLLGCRQETDVIEVNDSKKLDYYIEYYEIPDVGFEPQMEVHYEYNESGRPKRYTVYSFNPNTQAMEEQRHFELYYSSNVLHELKGYTVNETLPYVEYTYQYLPDGNLSSISEINHSTGLTSEANFIYNNSGTSVKVMYSYSNGNGFEYEFNYLGSNIVNDKTTKGEELCSNGVYTYDQKKNPFKTLGYIDYVLNGLSTNNKLTESVNYVACAFPSLIPVSYTYQYDDEGYPTESTTIYNSGNFKMKRKFFYVVF